MNPDKYGASSSSNKSSSNGWGSSGSSSKEAPVNKWYVPPNPINSYRSTAGFSSEFERTIMTQPDKTERYKTEYKSNYAMKTPTTVDKCKTIGVYNGSSTMVGVYHRTYKGHSPDRRETFSHELKKGEHGTIEKQLSVFSKGSEKLGSTVVVNYRSYKS